VTLTDDIRAACARVAARARSVRVAETAIEGYGQTLPGFVEAAPAARADDLERSAAHSLTLNAINFGSGWFPTLRKPPGLSGFRTVETALLAHGPWTADALAQLDAAEVAAVLGQDPEHELMALYAEALQELGERVRDEHGGAFLELARSGSGDLAALTLFADNLVPHVLRVDGVLEVDPALAARIERGELLEHGSPEEVELRACAVHAVELLVAAHGCTTAAEVDEVLWHRGAGARYKAVPRHRARTTAY